MRVLVTGARGLIGRCAITALRELGFTVVATSRQETSVPGAHDTVSANLLDAADTDRAVRAARATHLLHLAWHDDPKDRWAAIANIDWAIASLTLVRAFAEAGGKRALGAGSCAEYDWSRQGTLLESSPLLPATLYGTAKASTGSLLNAGARSLRVSFAWARIFFVYGPGEPPGRLLGDLAAGIRSGLPVDCTDGLQERDFLHAADVAAALAQVLVSDLEGPINIGSGVAVPVRSVIVTAAQLLGRPDLVRLGARPRADDDPPRIEADITRLAQLGFRPRFSLQSGLADALGDSLQRDST